jgi:ribosome-binding factor A
MKNTGDGRRVQKVEKEVQGVISMYLIHGFSQPLGAFANVTRTIMSGDLRNAKVYISILPKYKKEEESEVEVDQIHADSEELTEVDDIVDLLNEYAFEFQDKIASELKMRYVPKVKFYVDESTDRMIHVDKALSELEKNKDTKSLSSVDFDSDDSEEN